MKGSVLDVLVIPIIAFVLITSVIFTYIFLDQFNTSTSGALSTQAQTGLQNSLNQFLFWDQAIIILIAGTFIAALVGAAMINAHPVFFVGSVIALIVFIFIGAQITNIFMEIAGNASISATANLFPYTVQFFQNLPTFLVFFTLAITVVMFSFGGRKDGGY